MTKIAKCDEFKLLRAKTWHMQLMYSSRSCPGMLHGPYLKDRRDSYAHSTWGRRPTQLYRVGCRPHV